MLIPELSPLKHLNRALLWNAKLSASKGRMPVAIENIFTSYKVGKHKCRSNLLLMDQHNGLEIKKEAVSSFFVILNNTNLDSNTLKSLHDRFRLKLDGDPYIPSIQSEILYLRDKLQQYFIDNGKGTGRVAFNKGLEYLTWTKRILKLYYCFFGPTRKQTIEQFEKVCTISNQIMLQTPWQIKNGKYKYFEEIKNIKDDNIFLSCLDYQPESIFRLYHETKAQTEALLAVLAILRFKADKNRLPAALVELTDTGYLNYFPMDPYSNRPLVYKLAGDNFKLYSLGRNFSDDDGSNEPTTKQVSGFRGTYSYPCGYPLDIVYWPVKELKDPRKELTTERMEKLRAAKEADVFGITQAPNQPDTND